MSEVANLDSARSEKFRREHPKQAARIDALFQPIRDEMEAMNRELEILEKSLDNADVGE